MNEGLRPTIRVFLSYADRDAEEAEDLWGRLDEALRPSRSYRWELWAFRDQIRVGDDFDERIQAEIAEADLGVFAISNAFLNSAYIRDKELPYFLGPTAGKRVAPVLLKPLARDADLRGLAGRQIHGYHAPFWAGGRPHARDVWAVGLADELHRVAGTYGLGR
jgi:hypothetical protein